MSEGADLESNPSLSMVQVSLASPLQVQSVIQANQQIIQATQNSVIHQAGSGVPTIQVVRVEPVDDDHIEESESKKRQILTRRPSYRKIFNDLSSPVSVSKLDEESNSSQSQDGDSQDNSISTSIQYQNATGVPSISFIPSGAIQISVNADGTPVGLQTLTMTNASQASSGTTTAGATIVQYAQGADGQQYYIPASLLSSVGSAGTMQAYQIATSGTLPQGVVMATSNASLPASNSGSEEASRKRELRLLKNREAAKECRRKKKDYVKCLENRVAVLENQNKTLIEELKALKELYCQTEV